MDFTFRRAVREKVPLIIGLAGGTGSGKTYSAMRLAKGICGDKPFCVIDTEAGRAKHYADHFVFDHGDLMPPFRPDSYVAAIQAADKAGYPVIVVDSVSHIWAGDGGVLDWQDEELDRMAGTDWKKRESCKMAAWIKPKMAHKQFVQKLLQLRAHLILCLRAEPKIEMVKVDGKWEVVPKKTLTSLDGWIPVCEKSLPFELTISFLLMADKPGIPQPIKLQEQHRALFDLAKPVTEEHGKRLAEWATGAKPSGATTGLPAMIAEFAKLGTTAANIEAYLRHAPTEADIPEMREVFKRVQSGLVQPNLTNQNSRPANADHPPPPTAPVSRYAHMTDDALQKHLELLATRMGVRTYDEKVKTIIAEVRVDTWTAMTMRDRNEYIAAGLRTPEKEAAK